MFGWKLFLLSCSRVGCTALSHSDSFHINASFILELIAAFPSVFQGYHPLPHEAEIAHTKKLFRRRRNDRR